MGEASARPHRNQKPSAQELILLVCESAAMVGYEEAQTAVQVTRVKSRSGYEGMEIG